MKFQPDRAEAHSINGYGPGWVSVQNEKITTSVILGSKGQRQVWDIQQFEDLTAAHFAPLAEMETEMVIFGSGLKGRFVPPAWLVPLMAKRIGVETMDTAAACRTYNVLAGEGRNVVVALVLEM